MKTTEASSSAERILILDKKINACCIRRDMAAAYRTLLERRELEAVQSKDFNPNP